MEKTKLKVQKRDLIGKGVKTLRAKGLVPGIIYGRGKDNLNIEVSELDLEKILRDIGTASIVLLSIENGPEKNVLIHDVESDPLQGTPVHVDFYEVSMTEKITTTVPLHFVGDSMAVIDLSGTLVTNKDEVEVECLPGDLPQNIEVDISVLDDFEKDIKVSDIKTSAGVVIKDEPEEMVATVEPPRSEEELAELEETPEAPEMPEAEHGGEEETIEEEKSE